MSSASRREPETQLGGASQPIDEDFFEYRRTGDHRVRNRLVERHLGLAHHLARGYGRRGVAEEDLAQVATIGLLKSIERFDPERGASFAAFARPTILGELRQYFRDSTWAVHVPRRLQDRVLVVGAAVAPLAQRLGRTPNPLDIARATDLTEEEVLEALDVDSAYATVPLEARAGAPPRSEGVGRLTDSNERGTEEVVEQRLFAGALVARLSDRERAIVELRFARNLTQSEIAERMGISQMHVSRLLTRALAKMRSHAGERDASEAGATADPARERRRP